jgi:hypothetical protein
MQGWRSKALAGHGADPKQAAAEALGMSAGNISD